MDRYLNKTEQEMASAMKFEFNFKINIMDFVKTIGKAFQFAMRVVSMGDRRHARKARKYNEKLVKEAENEKD